MRSTAFRSLLAYLAVSLAHSASVEVLFIDVGNTGYITKERPQSSLDGQGLATAVHALTSSRPSFVVSRGASQQVEDLLVPNMFTRPRVLVSLQIPGLELGGFVDDYLLKLGPVKAYAFTDLAEKVFHSVATAASSGVQHMVLDHRAFGSCDDECTQQQLQAVLPVLSANYSATEEPLRGTLSLPAADGSGSVHLDLSYVPSRLLAVELANLVQAAVDAAQTAPERSQSATLLEGSLMSLQAIVHQFGKSSREAKAATLAVVKAVTNAVERLSLAFDGRLVLQLGCLGQIPLDNPKELLSWRDTHTARVLADTTATEDPPFSSTAWETFAAQILVLVILIIAILGSVYCMLYMRYKRDTLLYARPKAD